MNNEQEGEKFKSKYKLKKLIDQLAAIKGRHTELVTVYVPVNYSLSEIISTLRNEQSTSENIKSKPVRKNVTSALDKIIRHLQLYKKTPEHGLAIFCGNLSEKEGAADIQIIAIEPPEEIKVKMYWCDQRFVLEPLQEMVAEKEIYGIINLDKSDANIALLIGKRLEPLVHKESIVPGKTRAGGQCLVPDTLVQLSNGEIVEIKEIHNPATVKSAEFDNFSISDSPVLDKWDVRKDKKYRIITKFPRTEIEASKDHLFFTWGDKIEEKSAEELKVGDYLLMPERISIKGELQALNSRILYNSYKISEEGRAILAKTRTSLGIYQKELARRLGVTQTAISVIELNKRDIRNEFLINLCKQLSLDPGVFLRKYCTPNSKLILPETLDEKLAQVLGYFAGDGSFEKERLSFHEKDEKTIRNYSSLTKSLFNCNTHLRYRESKGYWVLRIHGKPIVNLFKREFPEIKGYSDTEIPQKVLKSQDSILASFLRGFFDAEGYVNLERGIGLGINNKKLARQIQISLLRFGILASLVEYDNRRNPYTKEHRFTISITEKESLESYSKFIGFSVPYKSRKLAEVLSKKSRVSYVRRIAVSGRNIRHILERYGMKPKDFSKVTNFFRNERLMSKNVFLNSILNEIKDPVLTERLRPILDYNLVPVKIKSIELIDSPSEMVDMSVKNENFIANGLVVHNSSARFSRIREGLLNDWLKEIGETANKIFEEHKEVLGIIVSGPGPVKEFFLKEDYLHADVKKRVLGTVDTGYTGEQGLEETIIRGEDLIKEASIFKEKKILQRFLNELPRPGGLAIHGLGNVQKSLELGAVDTVILYEKFPELDGKDAIEYFEEKVENYSTKLVVVSDQTREGLQFRELGGIGALLRYRTE